MATVTVELRNLLKTDFELFDFDYDFDDRKMAAKLEQAAIDHYYTHEIGQGTPDDFKRVFKNRWLSAMSYINDLHNTSLLEYNPLINQNIQEKTEELRKAISEQNTEGSSNNQQGTTTDGTEKNITEEESQGIEDTQTTVDSTSDNTSDSTTTEDIENSSTDTTTNKRTDNLVQNTDTNEIMSDYPQQSIAAGNYLSGEKNTESKTTNTGTVDSGGETHTDGSSSSESTNTSTNSSTAEEQVNSNVENQNTKTTEHNKTYGEQVDTQGSADTNSKTTHDGTDNVEYERAIFGITGITYQELIRQERENIMRLTGLLISELKPCFIMVY